MPGEFVMIGLLQIGNAKDRNGYNPHFVTHAIYSRNYRSRIR